MVAPLIREAPMLERRVSLTLAMGRASLAGHPMMELGAFSLMTRSE